MSFTDDDLKRLKEWCDGKASTIVKDDPSDLFKRLLARLEAAEKVINCHQLLEREMVNYDSFVTNLNAWRKAAGK